MLPLQRRFDLGPRRHLLYSFNPPVMRVADDLSRSVVFLGHGDSSSFKSCGTAFLLCHKGMGYLVTADHIAHKLGNDPFALRINGPQISTTIAHDPLADDAAPFAWITHEDSTVDIAIMPFHLDLSVQGMNPLWLSDDTALTETTKASESVGCGSACYAVGLFQLMQGRKRNLPVIHTGNIALMPSPEELVPVEDWRNSGKTVEVEAYLVEMTNLEGLSGAPVFVRPEFSISQIPFPDSGNRTAQVSQSRLYLIGVWQGSWTNALDRTATRYPLGMGVVVPIEKAIEIIESAKGIEAKDRFANRFRGAAQNDLATMGF